MKIQPIKTHKVRSHQQGLIALLDRYVRKLPERSILVITSKIVSLAEDSVISVDDVSKDDLIKQEADYWMPRDKNPHNILLTIKNNILIPAAGIDESNAHGCYVLWPRNPQGTANIVRRYLEKRFRLKRAGVIITDSRTIPLRWGTSGVSIAYSGFEGIKDYIGKPDIFGRLLTITKSNIADALATAAVACMGEGKEQTPMARITEVPFVTFTQRNPSLKELRLMHIGMSDDMYAPLLRGVKWRRGGASLRQE